MSDVSDFLDTLDGICLHQVKAGFVTNQDPDVDQNPKRPHISVAVCASGVCRGRAIHEINRHYPGETARYYSYADRRRDRAYNQLARESP